MTVDSWREAKPVVRGSVMLEWRPTARAESELKHGVLAPKAAGGHFADTSNGFVRGVDRLCVRVEVGLHPRRVSGREGERPWAHRQRGRDAGGGALGGSPRPRARARRVAG